MNSIFILQHVHMLANGIEDVKLIGAYQSRQSAEAAVQRLNKQPGFENSPSILDFNIKDGSNGFFIDEYILDQDHWDEGFTTI